MKTLFALFALVVLGVSTVAAQEDACYQKGGTWNADESKCVIAHSIEASIDHPIELAQHPIVEQTVDAFINETRTQFLSSVTAPEMFAFPAPGGFFLSMAHDEYRFSNDIVSLVFTVSDYTGGAHPNSYYQTFTFDLAQERLLTLDDLFVDGVVALSVIFPIVQQDLTERLGDMADASWIEQGTGVVPENYRNFAITPDELIFFFPPYQVAAYAAGPFEVHIPLSAISTVLAAPYSG